MVDEFFEVFAAWARETSLELALKKFRPRLPPQELAEYEAEYRSRMSSIRSNGPVIIHGPRKPWYPGPNAETDTYWPALDRHMRADLAWPDDRIGSLDQSSSKVIACTPPPPNEPNWDAKGLVVGYVQSGKTTNFTAVIAKAADVGYKFIIVFSGIHNGLRKQTQDRLDEQLCQLTPKKWKQLTNADDDFRAPAIPATALLHLGESGVALAVVKKNATVLRRLDQWLQPAVKQRALADVPTLIIDDEADQASVETSSINPLIRSIIGKLPKTTYIGYTATPFANVLIDPSDDDLYPKDFILNLPRPEGYFGTERVFGRDAVEGDEANGADLDGSNMVRIIPDEDVDAVRPVGRAAAADFIPSIPRSMSDAIDWFVLATAGRRARGDDGHSTMLIHTSVKTDVHLDFKDPLRSRVDKLRKLVATGDESTLDRLRALWTSETAEVPAESFGLAPPLDFDEVQAQLPSVLDGGQHRHRQLPQRGPTGLLDPGSGRDRGGRQHVEPRTDPRRPHCQLLRTSGQGLRHLAADGQVVRVPSGIRRPATDLDDRGTPSMVPPSRHRRTRDPTGHRALSVRRPYPPPSSESVFARIRLCASRRRWAQHFPHTRRMAGVASRRGTSAPKDAEWLRHNVDAADGFVARVRTAGSNPTNPSRTAQSSSVTYRPTTFSVSWWTTKCILTRRTSITNSSRST